MFCSKEYDEPLALDPIDPRPEYCEGVKIFTWDEISRTVRETLLEPLFQALSADSKWWKREREIFSFNHGVHEYANGQGPLGDFLDARWQQTCTSMCTRLVPILRVRQALVSQTKWFHWIDILHAMTHSYITLFNIRIYYSITTGVGRWAPGRFLPDVPLTSHPIHTEIRSQYTRTHVTHQLFSEPTLPQKEILYMVVPASLLFIVTSYFSHHAKL